MSLSLFCFSRHRNKLNWKKVFLIESFGRMLDPHQRLELIPDWYYQAATRRQLIEKSLWNVVWCSGYHDGVERSILRPAPVTVS